MRAEYVFYTSRNAKKTKTEAGPSTAAGPSAPVIEIEDSDSDSFEFLDFDSDSYSSEFLDFDSDDDSGVDMNQLRREAGP